MSRVIAVAMIDGDYWDGEGNDVYTQRRTRLELHDDGTPGAHRYRWIGIHAVTGDEEDTEVSASSRRKAMTAMRAAWGAAVWGLRDVRRVTEASAAV